MKDEHKHFLPDFCNPYLIISGIILAELLAIVLVLAPIGRGNYTWHYIQNNQNNLLIVLGWTSLFTQLVTLASLALLCLMREQFKRLKDNNIASILSYLLILFITWLASRLALEFFLLWNGGQVRDIYYYKILVFNLIVVNITSSIILGFCSYYHIWRRARLLLVYVLVLMLTVLFTELLAVFNAINNNLNHAIDHHLFLLRNLIISAIVSAIVLRYFYIQNRWKNQTEAMAYARVQALQARIRPHFLFNSMNTIASLIRINPNTAEQAVEDLAELFRASLGDAEDKVLITEELDLCIKYLRIEELRLGTRLQVSWNIEQIPKDALIPRLSIQPLLENAIYYGIQPLLEGGNIEITGIFDGDLIQLDIENPFEPYPSSYRSRGHGMAQNNIRERLHAHYKSKGSLTVKSQPELSKIYCISLRFPYENQIINKGKTDENFNRG